MQSKIKLVYFDHSSLSAQFELISCFEKKKADKEKDTSSNSSHSDSISSKQNSTMSECDSCVLCLVAQCSVWVSSCVSDEGGLCGCFEHHLHMFF